MLRDFTTRLQKVTDLGTLPRSQLSPPGNNTDFGIPPDACLNPVSSIFHWVTLPGGGSSGSSEPGFPHFTKERPAQCLAPKGKAMSLVIHSSESLLLSVSLLLPLCKHPEGKKHCPVWGQNILCLTFSTTSHLLHCG